MALGKRCGSNANTASEGLGLGFGCVRYTRSMSGKRVAISSNMEVDSTVASPPLKRQCSMEMVASSCEKSLLEALPQDILIRVLCGVGHDDLKQLFHVSKQIREATVIAKQWHFAYSTPKKISAFRNPIDLGDFEEAKTPNAPKQCRSHRNRLSGKKLADISVALFASPAEDPWPRRDLFMEMEAET
ncbi:hypothetical protein RHMOL_Rhmol13G0224300 [Rhododendron molle]|uniref:Uncharacterized protein n=1 Tax=Rhododendron molle TaxID=49168 RepID=A0ACC0LAH4_RHOML|nr:hypothetical protein RHMOL_Rhmol13G0224300 [Rhododendron molle]